MKSYQDYEKNITLSSVPDYYAKVKDLGDEKMGKIRFATAKLDDVYGEISTYEVSWEQANPIRYHVGRESTTLMNEYTSIGVNFQEKKLIKINNHDAFKIVGSRFEQKRGRAYMTNYILVNFCCDITKRKFFVKIAVFQENYSAMEEHLDKMIEGISCH
ncbi:MAG: hypothetical protein ACTSWN_04850 [Promethearchaeota archaeon]